MSARRPGKGAVRLLKDLVKLPLLDRSSCSPLEVRRIWNEFHAEQDMSLGRIVEPARLRLITERAVRCPMFMIPIWRKGNFFCLVSQFHANWFLVTTLESFQTNGDNARPAMMVTLYDELCVTKDAGLVRGDVIWAVTKREAERVTDLLLHYYSSAEYNVVRDFNERPSTFDVNKFVRENLPTT